MPGSVVLIGGEPGIGKSTLCLQLALAVEARGGRVLYVTGEESLEQVRMHAGRLGAIGDRDEAVGRRVGAAHHQRESESHVSTSPRRGTAPSATTANASTMIGGSPTRT